MELTDAMSALPLQRDGGFPSADAVNLLCLSRSAAWVQTILDSIGTVRHVAFADVAGTEADGVVASGLEARGVTVSGLGGLDPSRPTIFPIPPGEVNFNDLAIAAAKYTATHGTGLRLFFPGKEQENMLQAKPDPKRVEPAMADFAWLYGAVRDEESRKVLAGLVKARLTGHAGYLTISPFPHYFHPQVPLAPGSLVIDAGVSGTELDSTYQLSDAVGPDGVVLSLEPEPREYEMAKAKLASRKNVSLHNYGVSSREETVRFVHRGASSYSYTNKSWHKRLRRRIKAMFKGRANEVTYSTCKLRPIDAIRTELDRPVTAIKMDVEGGEMSALKGAEAVLRAEKPDLYISLLYHSFDDVFAIPRYIDSLGLGYAFYLGQHSLLPMETVLYAKA